MPRSGPTHHVDDTWRERVQRELTKRGWERQDLAEDVGCSPSVITDLLNGKKNQSPYVPDIHASLGWNPPNPPLLPEDQEEMLRIYQQLDAASKERLKGIGQGMAELTRKTNK